MLSEMLAAFLASAQGSGIPSATGLVGLLSVMSWYFLRWRVPDKRYAAQDTSSKGLALPSPGSELSAVQCPASQEGLLPRAWGTPDSPR